MHKRMWFIVYGLGVSSAALMLFIVGCQSTPESVASPGRQTLVLYSFSVQEEVLSDEVLPAFSSNWTRQTGEKVIYRGVFTGSEQIAQAILDGAPADVAILSNEQHAVWLRINDWVKTDWQSFPHAGIVSKSPIVIVVRPGNPQGIQDWADLGRPGVQLVHADPRTSGGAQWAILAEYGSAFLDNGDPEAAEAQLKGIWANVVSSPESSREALRQFLFGTGDALVTYEQDALLARSRGASIEIVMPPSTIMTEHVAVIVDRNVTVGERAMVQAFIDFLWSEDIQTKLTRYYFRAVVDDALNQAVPEFSAIARPFTVLDLGGWGQVYPEIIRGIWEERIASG